MYMIVEVSQYVAVASFSEAWIEMLIYAAAIWFDSVASFSEAWIEIGNVEGCYLITESPPSRRRGLKCPISLAWGQVCYVASFSEAWIEIAIIGAIQMGC